MFKENMSENKINSLRNGLSNDFRPMNGEADLNRLRVEDIVEILDYGWDRWDLQRMLDECDYRGVAFLAAWIRENRNGHTGFMIEDDEPYVYPLDEDGNYVEGAFGRCY
jgi:hypothetical protein